MKKNFGEVFEDLLAERLAEVYDFAEFSRAKERRKQAEPPKKKRIAGLHQVQG